jgi:hypothetical protein
MSRAIDWTKAGKRLRWQPKDMFGRNPDWNFAAQRWKDEADYYAELALCPHCGVGPGVPCEGFDDYHQPRKRAAGLELLRRHGSRFGGDAS